MIGWKKYALTAGIWLALFLSTLETTIVSTSLVSITNAVSGFHLRDWVVTAYLVTYTGFLVVYAKISEVFGRKTMYLGGLLIFIIFSLLCGGSTNILELIVFRAFQGMGASGIYSMTLTIAPALVPKQEFGKYIAIISTVFALASVLGPVLGGIISNHGNNWRWVFFLNGPIGVLAFALLAFLLPSSAEKTPGVTFLNHLRSKVALSKLRSIDIVGMFLLLASSVLIIFAFESAGTRYAWKSAPFITIIVLALLTGIIFMIWEATPWVKDPVFPPRLVKNRLTPAMLACTFFVGFPFTAIVVNIPQSVQAVHGYSPQQAGIVLLPLLLSSPVATAASGFMTSNLNVPPLYIILVGSVLQIIGVGLTCSLPTTPMGKVPAQQYGFEVIMGIGFGLTASTVLTLVPLVTHPKDVPVIMGALTQVRTLGGTISLAVCATLLNNHVQGKLANLLSPEDIHAISESLSSLEHLTPAQQTAVRTAFAEGYNKQHILLTVFAGVSFLCTLLLWEKTPRRVSDGAEKSELKD
ncbi:drug resistance transporter EmrB/QacA subfamily [Mariannaea sp. PMI_226]|nr:drug resistance transporter EmrB/QacA subfamily [Mariannaea sp. PMI_226]